MPAAAVAPTKINKRECGGRRACWGLGEKTRLAGADKMSREDLSIYSGATLAICFTLGCAGRAPVSVPYPGLHPSDVEYISPRRSPGVTRPKAVAISQMFLK